MEKRVIIVDDNPFVTKAVVGLLGGAGYTVLALNSPFGVTHAVAEFRPGLIILDYNIPGLKGDNIARILSHKDVDAVHKVVFYSSEDDGFIAGVVEKIGALGHISKRQPLVEFVRTISDYWRMCKKIEEDRRGEGEGRAVVGM